MDALVLLIGIVVVLALTVLYARACAKAAIREYEQLTQSQDVYTKIGAHPFNGHRWVRK